MTVVKSRREMYAEATRTAILEEATQLFAERGYQATSLEDVAAAAQVTRGAVYHHFSGKQALLEALLEQMERETCAAAVAAAEGASDAWEGAMLALDSFLEHCCDPVYGRVVWQEAPTALGWQRWQECEQEYVFGVIEGFVHQLIDAGYVERRAVDTMVWFCFQRMGAAGLRLANTPARDKSRVKDECAYVITKMMRGLRAEQA
jgi:AcrR family transcriptional regulator